MIKFQNRWLIAFIIILIIPFSYSTLKVNLDPPYNAELIAINEDKVLRYVFKNDNLDKNIELFLNGTALNFINAEIIPSGLDCSNKMRCSFVLYANESKEVIVKILGTEKGEGDLILRYKSDNEEKGEVKIKIKAVEELLKGVYNVPDIAYINLFIILFFAIFYLILSGAL